MKIITKVILKPDMFLGEQPCEKAIYLDYEKLKEVLLSDGLFEFNYFVITYDGKNQDITNEKVVITPISLLSDKNIVLMEVPTIEEYESLLSIDSEIEDSNVIKGKIDLFNSIPVCNKGIFYNKIKG